jgi:hypothetical protein
MKITITIESPEDTRALIKDYGDGWDFDVYCAADLFRDAMNVMGFTYVENVTIHSEDKEWSCRF